MQIYQYKTNSYKQFSSCVTHGHLHIRVTEKTKIPKKIKFPTLTVSLWDKDQLR
jgi:hypothetical protein